jgi:hypothetical protein
VSEQEKLIDPKLLRLDGGTQLREGGVNKVIVEEYAEAMRSGAKFAPAHVFEDEEGLWPGDGHHRAAAAIIAKKKLRAIVQPGGQRAAILFATGANGDHGLRRTNADKRRSVATLLGDEEWGSWSDRRIAEHAGVSNHLVASLRVESGGNGSHVTTRKGADGKSYTAPPPRAKAEPTRIVERIEVPDDDGWVMPAEDVTLLGEEGPDYEEGPGLPPDAADDEGPSGLSPSELNEHISRTLGEAFAEKLLTDEPWRAPAMPERAFAAPSFRAALANCVDDINGYLSNAATVYRHMKTLHEEAFAAGKVTEPLESFIPSPLLAMAVKFSELASMARQACDALIIAERAA